MNILSIKSNQSGDKLSYIKEIGWAENRPLRLTVILSVVLLVLNLIGLGVDGRTLLGEPIWLKPTKFAISSIFYVTFLMWILTMIKDRPRLITIVSWVTAFAMIGELVLISMQAFRGVRSHFNVAAPFDAAVFSIMGLMILSLWVASIFAWVALFRQKFSNRPWGTVLKWALLITVVGSGLGGTMTSPRSSQIETALETGDMPESGAHTVGVADGGAGLPGLGWSTEGGDLRIGHFLGLHALQIIPLIGLATLGFTQNRSEQQRVNLVHIGSIGYLGMIVLITWQAFRGEPLIYPSLLTLMAAGGFLLMLAAAGAAVVLKQE
ncbi:MAG: hypothetical protein ACI9EW_001052 [Cellvibrionaceae bacterium]|jgi:hypothetical protein